jgi:hypothetical protein
VCPLTDASFSRSPLPLKGPVCDTTWHGVHPGLAGPTGSRIAYVSFVAYVPDDGGSKLLCNVGQYLPDYTLQHPRRQPSSYTSPWVHAISRRTPALPSRYIRECNEPSQITAMKCRCQANWRRKHTHTHTQSKNTFLVCRVIPSVLPSTNLNII